jgi:hypothetical protein
MPRHLPPDRLRGTPEYSERGERGHISKHCRPTEYRVAEYGIPTFNLVCTILAPLRSVQRLSGACAQGGVRPLATPVRSLSESALRGSQYIWDHRRPAPSKKKVLGGLHAAEKVCEGSGIHYPGMCKYVGRGLGPFNQPLRRCCRLRTLKAAERHVR